MAMSAVTSIVATDIAISAPPAWDEAQDVVAEWRGRCIESCARIEHAAAETMTCLPVAGESKPQHLPSQRLARLLDIRSGGEAIEKGA